MVSIQNKIKKKEGIRKYTLTLGLITLQILKFQNVFKDCFMFLYTCLCVGGETRRPEKGIRYPAALQAVLNHPMLVLETELIIPCEEQFALNSLPCPKLWRL